VKRLCVIGMGYVGLTTATCFADLGNHVIGLDIDESKVESLRAGVPPIYEPGLEELLRRNLKAGRLSFTTRYEEAIPGSEFVFLAVGTPPGWEGEADIKYVRAAAESLAPHLSGYTVVVNKSTVPIGTGDLIASIIERINPQAKFDVVSNPEFLREGSAIHDFMNPDRIVLGASNPEAAEKVKELHAPLNAPVIVTDIRTAEMIKYASNAFLATRISFINEIAAICDQVGADVKMVAKGMGMDKRIGPAFLEAGLGFGGSCFPKDVEALAHMAAIHGCHPQLLRTVMDINQDQRRVVIQRLREVFGSLDGLVVGVLGLSFKPNTDDVRAAPAIDVIHLLLSEGARVRAYDPAAINSARKVLGNLVEYRENSYEVARGADALVVATEWNEFKQLDLGRIKELMRHPVIVDGRNIYEPKMMFGLGFVYFGIGRGVRREAELIARAIIKREMPLRSDK
jgi:UDPglucose 6-dehydrogenase